MTDPTTGITPEFQRGWDAALLAARDWHELQAQENADPGKTQPVSQESRTGSGGS